MATAGDDSDSGVSDTEVETREDHIFNDELMDLFKQGMENKGMFENYIIEIDALRKTFNQNANAVMVMVMQSLLMLPTIHWRQFYQHTSDEQRKKAAFTRQYFDHLHEVLRKFQALVAHFAQWKYAQENYKQGIEKAILLLYRQLILRIRQNIVDMLRVIEDETGLTFDAIIADIHAGKYGETLNDALSFGTIPLYEKPLPDTSGKIPQKPSPDAGGPERPVAEIATPHTLAPHAAITTDWEFTDYFTWRGGELSHRASDNTLVIPPNVIPRGQTWRIGIRVHTLLDEYDDRLQKCSNYKEVFDTHKQFRSSAVEFKIISIVENGMNPSPENTEFVEPVTIIINHSASESDMKALRVFCAEDNNTLQPIANCVPSTSANSFDAPYFQVKGRYVIIKTKHFCSYFTCICSDTPIKKKIKAINAIVYGRMVKKDRGEYPYKAKVDFGLQILTEDSVGSLPEFWERYVSQKLEKGMIKLDTRQLYLEKQLSFDCLTDLQVSWVFDDDDEESGDWITDPKFDSSKKEFKNVFPCHQQYTPLETQFSLKGKNGVLNAGIQLSFKQENNTVSREQVNFFLELDPTSKDKEKPENNRTSGPDVNAQQSNYNQQGDNKQNDGYNQQNDNNLQQKESQDLEDLEDVRCPIFEVERNTGRGFLSRQNLRDVAEHIVPRKLFPLGLALGFAATEIEHIITQGNLFNGVRQSSDMLNLWCTKQVVGEGRSIQATVDLLAAKLRSLGCLEASYIVQGLPHERIDSRDLYTLAEDIPVEKGFFLGLKLGFTNNEVESIKINTRDNPVGAVFQMLECWSDWEVGDNSLHVRVNTLIEALKDEAVGLTDVAERLTDYATSRELKEK